MKTHVLFLAPELKKLELELFAETPFLALPGIGSRVNSFYQNLEHHSQALLSRKSSNTTDQDAKLTVAFEDRATRALLWCVFQGLIQALNYGYNISILNVPKDRIESVPLIKLIYLQRYRSRHSISQEFCAKTIKRLSQIFPTAKLT